MLNEKVKYTTATQATWYCSHCDRIIEIDTCVLGMYDGRIDNYLKAHKLHDTLHTEMDNNWGCYLNPRKAARYAYALSKVTDNHPIDLLYEWEEDKVIVKGLRGLQSAIHYLNNKLDTE